MPFRVAIALQPQHARSYDEYRERWLEAEELGAETIYVWDHFYPLFGDPEGTHFECWMTLAAIAQSTTRVRMGALVSCNTYRNADLVADMARTLDHISGGRAILGIGSGWFERDYAEYGYPFGTVQSRLADFAEALDRIDARLAKLNPGPVNGRLPILVGGKGEKVMLRLVAEHATHWHAFGDPDELGHKGKVLDEWCRTAGRDPSEVTHVTTIPREKVSRETVQAYLDAGLGELAVSTHGPDYDLSSLKELLAIREALS
jgi:probable F420-dependent oxidoreductase